MTPTLPPMAYTVFALAPRPDRAATIAIINRLVNNGNRPAALAGSPDPG